MADPLGGLAPTPRNKSENSVDRLFAQDGELTGPIGASFASEGDLVGFDLNGRNELAIRPTLDLDVSRSRSIGISANPCVFMS